MGYERDSDRQELAEIAAELDRVRDLMRGLKQQKQRVFARIRQRKHRAEQAREGARKAKT